MTVFHDEIEIEDMEFDEENQLYHYPCPCGDRFEIRFVFLFQVKVLYVEGDFLEYFFKSFGRKTLAKMMHKARTASSMNMPVRFGSLGSFSE